MRVRVYRNLNKGGLSIQAEVERGKWRVVDWCEYVVLANCTYKVQQGGRNAVLKKRQKNVHAWIEGELVSKTERDYKKSRAPIPYYSPYKQDYFSIDGEPVTASDTARVYCPPK